LGQPIASSPLLHVPSPHLAQSRGQLSSVSLALHAPSPQYGPLTQSCGQLAPVSPLEHTPSPHARLQSAGHDETVSLLSQVPLPQMGLPQSRGQDVGDSLLSHLPLPQTGFIKQSAGQLEAFSEESHFPLPQATGQSFAQTEGLSSTEQTPSPQLQSSLQLARVSSGEHRLSPHVGVDPPPSNGPSP
jgi:hypothetical protein